LVNFYVKDTIRRIPSEAQEKIFDRFTRADNVDFKEGTGLGLSITKGYFKFLEVISICTRYQGKAANLAVPCLL